MHEPATETINDWVHVVQSEFAEMPGLQLSKRQAQRLWNLDPRSAEIVFDVLESSHFLRRTANNMYRRADIEY